MLRHNWKSSLSQASDNISCQVVVPPVVTASWPLNRGPLSSCHLKCFWIIYFAARLHHLNLAWKAATDATWDI